MIPASFAIAVGIEEFFVEVKRKMIFRSRLPVLALLCAATAFAQLNTGTITGKDWKRPDLRRKYGEYLARYLLEKVRPRE